MPSTRVLRSVVHNALDAYVSRYSSYQGYWLFGFLVANLDRLDFDLLAPQGSSGTPFEAAEARAVRVFREQLAKAGLEVGRVRKAGLTLRRGRVANVVVEAFTASGWELHASIAVDAVSDRAFHAERLLFVADHNPRLERRSTGAA
jgi:hypothetical protein